MASAVAPTPAEKKIARAPAAPPTYHTHHRHRLSLSCGKAHS